MHTIEMQKNVIRMRAEGKSIRSIADELDISPTTVCQWNKEFTADIRESHKQELEDVLDGLHASKLQRTRALVRAFKQIELYIQNKEFSPNDLRIYNYLMRLDRYINQDIMHDVPPLPPKHVCPDPIINVTTDMPIPPPRSKPAKAGDGITSGAAMSDQSLAPGDAISAPGSIDTGDTIGIAESQTSTMQSGQYDESNPTDPADAAEASTDPESQEYIQETTTFIAGGNRHRNPVTERTRTPAPAGASAVPVVVHKELLPPLTKGRAGRGEGSPTRDTINIHVDRNRNVTVSKIPRGTSLKRE